MEEHNFLDDYLEDLNAPVSQSTMDSEENLDEAHSIRRANEDLKKELAKVTEEYRFEKKLMDQQDKDSEIELLRGALERVTEERDSLQQRIEKMTTVKVAHKPVNNPLHMMLINQLKLRGAIKSREIEEVMRSIDRGDFAPKDPYIDRPQPIGFNTTISAPHMHATQLEILKECFKKAKKAIDIGTGSGYIALCLAKMMRGYKGKVYALDHIPKMIEQARENVAKSHAEYIEDGRIEFVVADGRECLPEHAPFDIIFVGGAVKEIPECFIEQLACGGSMIIPVGHFFQDLVVVHKTKCGRIEVNSVMPVMFGKLQSVEKQCPDIDD